MAGLTVKNIINYMGHIKLYIHQKNYIYKVQSNLP